MEGTFNRLFWNTTLSYLSLAVTFVCGFVMVPIALHYLGKENYGLLQLVGSIVSYVSLASLGTGTAIIRSVAEARDVPSHGNLSRIISTAFFFYLFIGFLGLIVTLGLARALPYIFQISDQQLGIGQTVLLIWLTGALVILPLSTLRGVLAGRERYDLINLIQIAQAIIFLSAGILVLVSGGGLIAFTATHTALTIISALILAWLAHREMPSLRLSPRMIGLTELKQLLSFGLFVFCVQVAVQISFQTDTIVIGMFLPLEAVAIYHIGLRLSDIAREIPAQINALLAPIVARLDRQAHQDELQVVLVESTKWILVVAFAVAVPLIVFAQPLLGIWVGPGFDQAVFVIAILCIAGVATLVQGPASTILMFKGRHRLLAGIALATSGTNFIVSLILVQYLGIIGVALGTAVAVIVGDILVNVPLACRLIRLPLYRFIHDGVAPAAIPAIIVFALTYSIPHVFEFEHLLTTILAMIGLTTIYLLLFGSIFLSDKDRKQYLLQVRNAICTPLMSLKSL